jgi:hypothetical protein
MEDSAKCNHLTHWLIPIAILIGFIAHGWITTEKYHIHPIAHQISHECPLSTATGETSMPSKAGVIPLRWFVNICTWVMSAKWSHDYDEDMSPLFVMLIIPSLAVFASNSIYTFLAESEDFQKALQSLDNMTFHDENRDNRIDEAEPESTVDLPPNKYFENYEKRKKDEKFRKKKKKKKKKKDVQVKAELEELENAEKQFTVLDYPERSYGIGNFRVCNHCGHEGKPTIIKHLDESWEFCSKCSHGKRASTN